MIKLDLGEALRSAEDFIRPQIKSKAVRAAEKRRLERRQREAWRTTKRASAVAGVSAAGAFGLGVTMAPLASAAIAAGAAAVAGLALAGMLPKRRITSFSREELVALPCRAEEWLLDQRAFFPKSAAGTIDAILAHLGDLPPHLARLDPNATLAWDARKLLGEHLPNLVSAWCNLPSTTREHDWELRQRFERGLATIAEEVARLTAEASRDERMRVETHGRFLDARYRDDLPA